MACAARPPAACAQEVAPEDDAQAPRLRLEDALRLARGRQPSVRRARAELEFASARAAEARASLLPQLSGSASYQRTTGNFVPRPGQIPRALPGAMGAGNNTQRDPYALYDFYSLGVTLSQLLYDFGASSGALAVSKEILRAEQRHQDGVALEIGADVSAAFLQALALQQLVVVARENLANSERHLQQTQSFVQAGTRPEIDLFQLRTDVANARVRLIEAENARAIGKAALDRAMGREDPGPYTLAEESPDALPEESQELMQLYESALKARPDLAVLEHRARAQRLAVDASRSGYGPALSASTSLTAGGLKPTDLVTNWNVGLFLAWPILQGGLTRARVAEARAMHEAALAEQDAARLAVHFELAQARLGIEAAKAARIAAHEAASNAEERFKLAEKRYAAGVGNGIELADAQVALTSAHAQEVHAAYVLGLTRVSLRKALGERE